MHMVLARGATPPMAAAHALPLPRRSANAALQRKQSTQNPGSRLRRFFTTPPVPVALPNP
jgi:hypothetical protein